jgi:lysylphosphatidylglycerol synthetase-like protein (DUF2156 family)
MIWKVSTLFLTLYLILTTQNVIGQDVADDNVSSVSLNDTTADQLRSLERIIEQNDDQLRSLERIIEQNDGSSVNSIYSSYIGMMAFLVGIALVIFGFQLSRAEKATPTARRAYRVLILALLVPVVSIFLYAISPFSRAGETHSEYLGVASLLMIPTVAVLALMASGLHQKL